MWLLLTQEKQQLSLQVHLKGQIWYSTYPLFGMLAQAFLQILHNSQGQENSSLDNLHTIISTSSIIQPHKTDKKLRTFQQQQRLPNT
jgi:hypothetical protein